MPNPVTFKIKILVDGRERVVEAAASSEDLSSSIAEASREASTADKSFLKMTQSVMALDAGLSLVRQLADALNSVTEESRSFAEAMRAANTMAGKDAAGFDLLSEQVSELSRHIPVARDKLANGLYQVVSNGVPEDNWISYLEASARSAVGGIADVGEVVRVTSTIIKNYAMEWSSAQEVQDKIQLTAKNGVTSFAELASALPSVTGQAAQLGVSLDEVLAVMSTLTGVTGNTSEVSTQLASVLTALTKESHEAQEAAQAMGIEFNAASIKSAGGLRNFLTDLDRTVSAYADKTGTLKESIYSQLFGRAEALRMVNALTGNLSEKFQENISSMADSAGVMNGAFDEMASTGSAKLQMLKNAFGGITDAIAGITGTIGPLLTFGSQIGMMVISVSALSQTFGKLHLTTKLVAAAQSLWNKQVGYGRAYVVALSVGAKGLAIQAAAARVAMLGLMALPVVAVIGAIAAAFGAFSSSADDATAATQQFNEAEQQAAGAAAQAKEEIEKELEKVNELIAANDESAATVQHLNQKYGDIFGTYSTLAQWQKVISENESVYCRLIREESILHSLNAKIVEKETSLLQKRNFIDKVKENQSWVGKVGDWLTGMTSGWEEELTGAEAELASLKSLVDQTTANIGKIRSELKTGISEEKKTGFQLPTYNIQAMTIKELDNTIQHLTETISTNKDATDAQKKEMGAMISQMEKRKAQLEKLYGIEKNGSKTSKTRTKEHKRERTEYERLGDEIKKLEDRAGRAGEKDLAALRQQIAKLKERRSEIEATLREVNRPLKLDTLGDVNEELKYYQALLLVVGEERRKEVNGEIRQLETLAAKMTLAGHMQLNIADINDLRTLEEEEQYYQQLYNLATSDEERAAIARQRVELEKKRAALEAIMDTARRPADISQLNTLQDLDEAIQWYGALQSRQSADEYAATQKTINALTAKKAALERVGRVMEMQDELSELGTGTKTARLELKTLGFDGLESRIQELQAMLDDMNHPVTDKQRADILATMEAYRQYQRSMALSFDTFKDGWGAVTGMVSGIQGLTNALADHKSAWDIATSAVDTFISIYEGIETVIQILRMLGILTEAHAASKVVEGGAVGTEAGVQTAAAAENAVAMGIETAAAKANTAALLEMAAAGYMAAHAYIPFAGFGIAAGFTASAAALVKSIGATAFADGGLVSGPTLGLIGEYAGARSNPEVVAPLDRLRSIIHDEGMKGEVDFKIRARRLVGILKKEKRHSER